MFFTCNECKYTFVSEKTPERCPDCGKIAVRKKVYKKYELESTAMVEMICVTISIWYLIKNYLSIDIITVLLLLLTGVVSILLHCILYRLNWNKVKQLIGMHH